MLRLRPSELTLTADDVEETFRRMARRQAARNTAHLAPSKAAVPGRPALRRGPQRAVRDAITTLGDIPILRPQPHRALSACADDDIQPPPSSEMIESPAHTTSPSVKPGQTSAAVPSTPSTSRRLHLPFRLGRSRRDSATHTSSDEDDAQTTSRNDSLALRSGDACIDDSSTPACPGKTPATSRRRFSCKSPAELRGGYHPKRHRNSDDSDDAACDVIVTPIDRTSAQPTIYHSVSNTTRRLDSTGTESGMLYLRGRPADPARDPPEIAYTFDEFRMGPQTEPRPASKRRGVFTRSLSSGSRPRHQSYGGRERMQGGSDYDPFSLGFPQIELAGPAQPTRGRSNLDVGRARQGNSESSNTTDAFSLYELPPETRRSSSGTSNLDPPWYDGSSASVVGGGYRSVRASNTPSYGHSTSQRHELLGRDDGNHDIVPQRSASSNLDPSSPAFIPGNGYVDAATAAVQDLVSPLQPFSEQYQRMENLRRSAAMSLSNIRNTRDIRNRTSYSPLTFDPRRPYYGHARPLSAQPIILSGFEHAQHVAQPERGGISMVAEDRHMTQSNALNYHPNAGILPAGGQVQTHREAYERMHNAQQALEEAALSMPSQPSFPRDTSNRPRPPPMTSSLRRSSPLGQARDGFLATQTSAYLPPGSILPVPPVSRAAVTPVPINVSDRHPHHYNTFSDISYISPYAPRNNTRDFPQPQLDGTINPTTRTFLPQSIRAPPRRDPTRPSSHRYSAVVRPTTTRPRIPSEQRDQENSGVAEDAIMRREGAAIETRYGAGGEERLDETPPRVGRIERRIRE